MGGSNIRSDADNPDRVLDSIYSDADGTAVAALVPTNQITMRISRVFKTKAEKYHGNRETGKIPQDAIRIIAINARDIPRAWPTQVSGGLERLLVSGHPGVWQKQIAVATRVGPAAFCIAVGCRTDGPVAMR